MTARAWAVALVLLTASSASAYRRSVTSAGDALAWVTNCIDYFLHEDGSDDINFNSVEAEVVRAFNQWENVDCSDVNFTYSGTTAEKRAGYFQGESNINLVVWREGVCGPGEEGECAINDWEHDPRTIAVTTNTFCTDTNGICPFKGAIIDSDIEMNGERFRFTNARVVALTEFDLGNTLTHEVGHLIGLDHSAVEDSTMFLSAPPGELSKRDLEQDDVDGVCEVFPIRPNEPACYQITGNGQDGEVSQCDARPGQAPAVPVWLAVGALFGLLRLRRRAA